MQSHRNRNNRRSGGDRRFTINVPELTAQQKAAVIIGAKIDQNPDWELGDIGNWAFKELGMPLEMVVKILNSYCAEDA